MKAVVYQLFVRHFSNECRDGLPWGTKEQNGCGTFNAVNDAALSALAQMGVTHLWLTGVLRHATQTSYEGLPASPASVVKGLAGSPYAVTDYYDVDPDLAEDPARRREEFRALLQRVRRWGMLPMIDLVPNHVSRCYRSLVRPEEDFGKNDNPHVFFARDNSFYYVEPCCSDRALMLPDGEFEPERGRGRVTGNNAATWEPSVYDWYETVKLNYGTDYRHGAYASQGLPGQLAAAAFVPETWRKMDAILAYWQEQGVGGFRCDMAHMLPMSFWSWAIACARLRDGGVYFMAEGYNDHMKLCEGDVHEALLAAGFNSVYGASRYQALRDIYEGGAWANDLDQYNRDSELAYRGALRYLENHDEPRLAAPSFWGGVGWRVAPALECLQYCASSGPVLIYNGQECGERAEGPGGFGGDNGRSSIFDYTCLPRFQGWTNHGAYDGGGMTEEEARHRRFLCRLLPLLQHPALSKGGFYGLNWANMQTPGFGRMEGESISGHYLYAFLRHYRKAKATLLVVCNLSPTAAVDCCVHIPRNAMDWAGKKSGLMSFTNLLQEDAEAICVSDEMLENEGLPVSVPAGQALLMEWK